MIIESDRPASDESLVNLSEESLPKLPTAQDPRLKRLFISPSDYMGEKRTAELKGLIAEDKRYGRYGTIAISDNGCPNRCIICGEGQSGRMVTMPFPMILAVADELYGPGSTVIPYRKGDPFYYGDEYFDADLGDAAACLLELGINVSVFTHFWWKGDKYAPIAAEKFNRLGLRANVLSINLFREIPPLTAVVTFCPPATLVVQLNCVRDMG
jgi:hypothetical protein